MAKIKRLGIAASFIFEIHVDMEEAAMWDDKASERDIVKIAMDYAMRRLPSSVPIFGPNLENVKIELMTGTLHAVKDLDEDAAEDVEEEEPLVMQPVSDRIN